MEHQSKLYFVRHAQSIFNIEQMKARNTTEEVKHNEDLTVKFDLKLIDCGLSELGIEQAKQAAEKLKNINVGLVVTSPLRRSMETAHIIFKDHKDKPRIVVWPIIKEMLLSTCDCSDDINIIKREFPEMDFSLIDENPHPELWLLYVLKNKKVANELIEELFAEYPTKEEALANVKYFLARKVKEAYPKRLEHQTEINERTQESKGVIKKALSELPEGKSMVVVSHSRYFESFTAKSFEHEGEPIGSKWFVNGEVYGTAPEDF